MTDAAKIRFYFSFRSPYAWLAAERLDRELGDLGIEIDPIPIFPTPALFPNDPSAIPEKVAHLVQDVARIARAQGLAVTFSAKTDCDWSLPHAAALGALREGHRGQSLILELFRQRFQEGLNLDEGRVIAKAAVQAGLDPGEVVAFAHSPELREAAASAWASGVERDGIFGVPSFAYAGKLYWGQDRMHFLRSSIQRKASEPK